MKKRTAIIILLTLLLATTTTAYAIFGNKDYFDTVKTFHEALIAMPDGTVVQGKVQNWRDYENSDQIQVKINDVTYLVHSSNIMLMHIH